jgi:hypothetical protein
MMANSGVNVAIWSFDYNAAQAANSSSSAKNTDVNGDLTLNSADRSYWTVQDEDFQGQEISQRTFQNVLK